MISSAALLRLARNLLDVPTDQYVGAAADELARVLSGDDVMWVESDWVAQRFAVWRRASSLRDPVAERIMADVWNHPAVQHYVSRPADLTPQRLSDLPVMGDEQSRAAQRLSQETLGTDQLSVVTAIDPPARGRAWILGRDRSTFDDDELGTARRLAPVLVVLDRLHEPRLSMAPAPGEDDGAASDLTRRERQVLDLLSVGLTARAIGHVLGISPRTVNKHLENSYRKLGRHDRLLVALDRSPAPRDLPRRQLPGAG